MACHAHTHKIFRLRHNNLPVFPMKGVGYWSHMSTLTTDENYIKNFCHSFRKQRREGKEEDEEKQADDVLAFAF